MSARLIIEETGGKVRVGVDWGDGAVAPDWAGDAEPWTPPFSAEQREDLRWYLEDYLRAPYAVWEDRGRTVQERLPETGERLFDSVFGGGRAGRDLYQRARGAEDDFSVWISSESPGFLSQPWELLRDGDSADYLAVEGLSVNRRLPSGTKPRQVRRGETIRVLMVIARPSAEHDVRYQIVARPLLERIGALGGAVELEILRPARFEALKVRLEDKNRPVDVLHFDGHGVFGAADAKDLKDWTPDRWRMHAPRGAVVFEGDEEPQFVSAEDFAAQLRLADVPVVIFNACQSGMVARVGQEEAAALEAAVATRLLQSGTDAVVAMGYSVYAVAAAEFMTVFYDALLGGRSVADAVSAGRMQMRRVNERPSPRGPMPLDDWMVPVHYAHRDVSFPQLERAEPRAPVADALEKLRTQDLAGEAEQTPDPLAPRNRFFGRDNEIYRLEQWWDRGGVAVLHGVGGVGKTELAKAFARWLRDSGGLDAAHFYSFEPGLASFSVNGPVTELGLQLTESDFVRNFPEPAQRRAVVLELLRRYRILLVWDNFETVHSMPDATRETPPLTGEALAEMRHFVNAVARAAEADRLAGGILITSRSPEDGDGWLDAGIVRIPLTGLAADDAGRYADFVLRGRAAAQARRASPAYGELTDYLAGHPLSLRLILPHLERHDAADLLAALRGEAEQLPPGFEASDARTEALGASVRYSYASLGTETQRRLCACALFEGVVDADVLGAMSAADECPDRFKGVERDDWAALCERAREAGLLSEGGVSNVYAMHPALPAYLAALWREQAGDGYGTERKAAVGAMVRAHAALGEWLNRQIEGGSAETAMAVMEIEQRSVSAALGEALNRARWEDAQAILQPLNNYWGARGRYAEADAWCERAMDATSDGDGAPPEFDTPAGALWLFAAGAHAQRMSVARRVDEAENAYDEIREALEASDSPNAARRLAVTYHQLGYVVQARGDLDAAEQWYRKSLEIKESLGDRPGMASSFGQLGIVAQDRGDLDAAGAWYRKSLQIFESLRDRPHLAAVYHQLGVVAQDRGDLDAAEAWYRESLKIDESLGNRPGMATSYHQLGTVAQDRGDLKAAEEWYRKSLEIKESVGDRPGIAKSYHQLGRVAQDHGDLDAAEAWYRRSLEIEESLGNRPGMATSYHQLGRVAQLGGDLDAAEAWYRKSLEIEESLGDRPGMVTSYATFGLLAEERGNSREALDWTVRCVSLFEQFPHPSTGPGPKHLLRLTRELGVDALRESWKRCTGRDIPRAVLEPVRRGLERLDRVEDEPPGDAGADAE